MSKVYIIIKRSDDKEFKINYADAPDWKLPSDGLEGFGSYANDVETTSNAVGDGDVLESSRVAKKDRTIKFVSADNSNNSALRDKVSNFFTPKYTFRVYVTYQGRTRWVEGVIHKFDMPTKNIYRKISVTVTFLCPNPYLKSYDDFGQDIASVSGRIAFPYLCSSDDTHPRLIQGITGGVFNFAQQILLSNDGAVDTYCKCEMKAKGEVINPVLYINGNYVRVLDTLEEGDVISMDFAAQPPTVKKNGVNFIGHCDRTSAFDNMALPIGDSEVSFNADNGSNLLAVSIYYNKLYSSM